MVWILSIIAALMLISGFYDLGVAQTAMQQIVGMLSMLIATVLFSTVAIIETLNKNNESSVDELAEYRNIPKEKAEVKKDTDTPGN